MIQFRVWIRAVLLPIVAISALIMMPKELESHSQMAETGTSSPGTLYFVAPSGDDSNPGTETQPWRTIQKAASTLVAGDTVYVRAGIYPEQVVPKNSGSPGSYITYAAYAGETVTIDGSAVTLPDGLTALFYIDGKSYINVSGLHVINAGPYSNNAGIMVINNSSYITVENNSTLNTDSSGIGVWGSNNIVVDGNRIDEAGISGYQECISVDGTDTFEVRNNEVLNCLKEGIDIKNGSSNGRVYRNRVHHTQEAGILVDAWLKHTFNIEVYQNVVHDILDNQGFLISSEAGGLLENVWVFDNIAYNNRFVGLYVMNCCPDPTLTHPMKDITITNNTFYGNGTQGWGGGIMVDNADIQNVVLRNNIVSQNYSFQIALGPDVPSQNITIDRNLIDGYRGYTYGGETRGVNYLEGDPLFLNAAEADFHLRGNSPAVDNGLAEGAPSFDFDGRPRPLDGNGDGITAFDVGAFETPLLPEHVYLPLILKGY